MGVVAAGADRGHPLGPAPPTPATVSARGRRPAFAKATARLADQRTTLGQGNKRFFRSVVRRAEGPRSDASAIRPSGNRSELSALAQLLESEIFLVGLRVDLGEVHHKRDPIDGIV
ncbi:MAG: hypothetical protein DME86_09655 [Verrucomicrobia bacterium]|nr:MAG: hypothetical protein DME86_09655 [Verrucomicrobiota bacterium]